MKGLFTVTLALAVLMAMPLSAKETSIRIQVVNPAENTTVQLFLNKKLIYEAAPTKASLGTHGALSEVVGNLSLSMSGRHLLVARIPGTQIKAQLEWEPDENPNNWIVVHYYPGRQNPPEPPFFKFALQREPFLLK